MKATLYIATTLNGLITRGEADSGWVSPEDEKMFAEICRTVGCILVGRQTFEQYQGTVYPVPKTTNIVLSTNPHSHINPDVTFVSSLSDALKAIKNAGHDRFVVVGGARVIHQCFAEKLIDRVYLSLHPYLFGEGLSVFDTSLSDINLSFEGVKAQSKDFILLDYKVISYD